MHIDLEKLDRSQPLASEHALDNYCGQSLAVVEDSGVLSEEALTHLQSLQDELQDSFAKGQLFRTRTEMEVSVLNDLKFPTPDSKYWQAVREQNTMFGELVMLSYEYRKNMVEIKKLERDLAREEDDLERELLEIEIAKKKFIALNQRRTAQARAREIWEWHEIKEQLVPKMTAGFSSPNDHQLISYTKRWIGQFLAMNGEASPAERANLIGQLDKGLKLCRERGLLDKVLPPGSRERQAILAGSQTE